MSRDGSIDGLKKHAQARFDAVVAELRRAVVAIE